MALCAKTTLQADLSSTGGAPLAKPFAADAPGGVTASAVETACRASERTRKRPPPRSTVRNRRTPVGVRGDGRTGDRVEICAGGALIEAPFTLALNSWHSIRLGSEATFGTLDARVCHVAAAKSPARYLIGLEFVAPDPLTAGRLNQIVADAISPSFLG